MHSYRNGFIGEISLNSYNTVYYILFTQWYDIIVERASDFIVSSKKDVNLAFQVAERGGHKCHLLIDFYSFISVFADSVQIEDQSWL